MALQDVLKIINPRAKLIIYKGVNMIYDGKLCDTTDERMQTFVGNYMSSPINNITALYQGTLVITM